MTAIQTLKQDEVQSQFGENGFVILRGLLDTGVVHAVRQEIEKWVDEKARLFKEEGLIGDLYEDEPFETRLIRVFAKCPDRLTTLRAELHRAGMFGLFFNPSLLDVVERLLGPEIRLYPNYSVRPKMPDHAATEVLWHQDGGYTEQITASESGQTVDQLRMVNVWTPLVPARVENGCMQFIPCTHQLGVVPHVKKQYYLQIVDSEIEPRLKDAIDVILDPGDGVLFSNLLFHRGQPNRSSIVRWSCDWRYQDATQPTLRCEQGHIARSRSNHNAVVKSSEQWASLCFG